MNQERPEVKPVAGLGKILWRLKVLVFESLGKNWDAVKLSLSPAEQRRNRNNFLELLRKHKVIDFQAGADFFTAAGRTFYFSPQDKAKDFIVDFISIWGNDIKFIRRNLIKSSAYYFEGPYEHRGAVLEPGDIVIDAGANLGLFAVLAGEKIGTAGQVFAFEPIAETRRLLLKNIKINRRLNIKLVPNALGRQNGQLDFAIFNSLGDSSGYFQTVAKKERVEQITLDDFVNNNELTRVDFIKADIEGMERELLKGAERTIKKFKPKIAICLYHRLDDPEVLENFIKSLSPEYKIEKTRAKLFAWV